MADSTPEDWTERYRPQSTRDLEGNDTQRKRIRNWLTQWERGVPAKRGMLLTGPPGVGKTSLATAIANDMCWDVIELNASDQRNAAAIRRASTGSGNHFTFNLDGSFSSDPSRRTLPNNMVGNPLRLIYSGRRHGNSVLPRLWMLSHSTKFR